MSVRVRFAPAPTGDLHIGGAMVAVAKPLSSSVAVAPILRPVEP